MGGAVASLVALFAPKRVASLTLIAPGGFGEAIGFEQIRAVMGAETFDSLSRALAGMGASGWTPSRDEVEAILARRTPQGRKAIAAIFRALFATGRQGVLPLDAIAATGVPVKLLWGALDPVTPHAQGEAAPFELRTVPGAGHLLMQEAPEACRAPSRTPWRPRAAFTTFPDQSGAEPCLASQRRSGCGRLCRSAKCWESESMGEGKDNVSSLMGTRRLADAVRQAKIAAAQRSDVVVDIREADHARLEILLEELQPLLDELPPGDDYFDFFLSGGQHPRLWIDGTGNVVMARDRRTYRFVRETRLGRLTIAESTEPRAVAEAITTMSPSGSSSATRPSS